MKKPFTPEIYLKFRILICLIFYGFNLKATHIVGGDITYRCLGGQEYEISLTVRRDCLNGQPGFDNPASIGIFDFNGTLQRSVGVNGRLVLPYRTDDTLNEVLQENCGIIGGDLCVHTTTYKDTVHLPIIAGGYILSYQRCCRNYTILNIIDPLATGATYTVHITENALRSCNSSPVLSPYPPIYICANQAIEFNLNAKDKEGDSLVYIMCDPNLGANQMNPIPTIPSSPPYLPVQFKFPYNTKDMIGGQPPLQIDSKTGRMIGFAEPLIAQYLIAYCVEEYRNGKLLSILRRDFQINVRFCNSVPIADFDFNLNNCLDPVELQLKDKSSDLFSNINSWDWEIQLNGKKHTSSLQNPIFRFTDTGIAKVQLIIRSAAFCNDTITQIVSIHSVQLQFDSLSYTICRGDSITLVKSYSTQGLYTWKPTSGLSCADCPNPKASPIKDTKYLVTSTDGNCTRVDTQMVFVKNCAVDSCAIFIDKTCLSNGMIQLTALDAYGKPVSPKLRTHELFWNVRSNSNYPEISLYNKNPILLTSDRIFNLNSKLYSWKPGRPKTIEFAEICQRSLIDSSNLECSGPCEELNFILSSCEDDYDIENDLDFPPTLCESICSNACQYIVALFETNGTLIDPLQYKIKWNNGSSGSYVMLMGPYYNTLTVEVQKGDCIWYGRYWKSCKKYSVHSDIVNPNLNNNELFDFRQVKSLLQESKSICIYNQVGKKISQNKNDLNKLYPGVYFIQENTNGANKIYRFIR